MHKYLGISYLQRSSRYVIIKLENMEHGNVSTRYIGLGLKIVVICHFYKARMTLK